MSGLALGRAFAEGSMSPVEALRSCQQRIDAVDEELSEELQDASAP